MVATTIPLHSPDGGKNGRPATRTAKPARFFHEDASEPEHQPGACRCTRACRTPGTRTCRVQKGQNR